MRDWLGIWVGIVFPIVVGVVTALVLAVYAEREKARRLKGPKEKWPAVY